MSTDTVRRAAEAMRRENSLFLDSVADLLMEAAMFRGLDGMASLGRIADEVAESFMADPGDVPAVV